MFAYNFKSIEDDLNKIGIAIRISDGAYKTTTNIIKEIGRAWTKLDPIQEEYMAQRISKI